MVRIGLVLGAGGVIGEAYHAGALAALADATGFDARDAEIVIGTSAGSIMGTLLRLGVAPRDLGAWMMRQPLSESTAPPPARTDAGRLAPFDLRDFLRAPSAPTAPMLRGLARRPWRVRPVTVGLSLMAPGRNDIVGQIDSLMDVADLEWPERPLWLPVVRRSDGRRVVLGRAGAPPAPLNLAVAASCSVPGYFRPVRIDGVDYIDGGAHSPTNAALLRAEQLDRVVVVSPMSGSGEGRGLAAAQRRHSGRRLRREVAALRRAGHDVLVLEPNAAELAAMGPNLMSPRRVPNVVETVRRETERKLANAELAVTG
jgi:NTE family protein